ncbi:hypothetical protein Hdeb2414_s0008g00274771 [Helianthus debilis subsp. tardiflorus]
MDLSCLASQFSFSGFQQIPQCLRSNEPNASHATNANAKPVQLTMAFATTTFTAIGRIASTRRR